MIALLLALLIGVVAGLRAFLAPTAVSWAAYLGLLRLDDTWLAFLGYTWTPWILTLLALVELVTDQLPATPSRTVPMQFGARLVMGAAAGAALGAASGQPLLGAVAGIVGAVMGTLAGQKAHARMAAAFGRDPPAALIEDAVAIVAALLIVIAIR